MSTRALAIAVKALEETADDIASPNRIKAASKIIDFVFPPTTRLEVEVKQTDSEQLREVKAFALEFGIPLVNLLGPNAIGSAAFADFLAEWRARWGDETPEQQFERLCVLAARMLGPPDPRTLTDEQRARAQAMLDDPRNTVLARLPVIDAEFPTSRTCQWRTYEPEQRTTCRAHGAVVARRSSRVATGSSASMRSSR